MWIQSIAAYRWASQVPQRLLVRIYDLAALVAPLFKRTVKPTPQKEERGFVLIGRRGEDLGVWRLIRGKPAEAIANYLNRGSSPYPLAPFRQVLIARSFFSDLERSGEERLILNGEEIAAPITDGQKIALLQTLLDLAGGNEKIVQIWTRIWNLRPKSQIRANIATQYLAQRGRHASRIDYKISTIALDTENSTVTCFIRAIVTYENDSVEIYPVQVEFAGHLSLDFARGAVQETDIRLIEGRRP